MADLPSRSFSIQDAIPPKTHVLMRMDILLARRGRTAEGYRGGHFSEQCCSGTYQPNRPPQSYSRRCSHILDAAEACFIRNGFHRTTMIDLAREARISPGNFYRYFPSKEGIVLALAERDRERGAALIAEIGRTGDLRDVLMGVLAQYFFELTREAAVLRLDFWAEATRNPAIAAMVSAGDAEGRAWLTKMFGALAISPLCDPSAMVEILSPVMKGMVIDRALRLDYDPAPVVKHLCMLIEAGLNGSLSRKKK